MLITYEEIKQHLYLSDDSDKALVESLIMAAEEAVLVHLNRLQYDELIAQYSKVPEPVRLAIKMLVGNWYINRESVSNEKQYKVPHTLDYLLSLYIKY